MTTRPFMPIILLCLLIWAGFCYYMAFDHSTRATRFPVFSAPFIEKALKLRQQLPEHKDEIDEMVKDRISWAEIDRLDELEYKAAIKNNQNKLNEK